MSLNLSFQLPICWRVLLCLHSTVTYWVHRLSKPVSLPTSEKRKHSFKWKQRAWYIYTLIAFFKSFWVEDSHHLCPKSPNITFILPILIKNQQKAVLYPEGTDWPIKFCVCWNLQGLSPVLHWLLTGWQYFSKELFVLSTQTTERRAIRWQKNNSQEWKLKTVKKVTPRHIKAWFLVT